MSTEFRLVRVLVLFFLLTSLGAPRIYAAQKKKSVSGVSARAAILMDVTKQKRLYGKDVDRKVKPASTAKVMTALLVMENLSLDRIVTVSSRAVNVQPSQINLKSGEQYRVAELLFALLLNSANDASIVLAEAVAGSEAQFVRMMNQRAQGLGARRTHFANSNGLPTSRVSQYTSAYDMSLIFREALKHTFFKKVIAHTHKTIQSQTGRVIALKNHNKLLFTSWGHGIHGKTGYTRSAQACFVGYTRKGNNTLIVAVFGCRNRWDDIRYILRTYGRMSL